VRTEYVNMFLVGQIILTVVTHSPTSSL
jgi:hypothetical protein